MSDTNPNTPPEPTTDGAALSELNARLREFATSVKKELGIDPAVDEASVLTLLGKVVKERDENKSALETERGTRVRERVESSIRNAFDRSGLDKNHLTDALTLMKPLFHLDEKGRVVTRGGDTGEPGGLSPEDFVASRLKSLRSHWYPTSIGGGAKGGGFHLSSLGDTSAFDPRSPNFSVTRQYQLEVERGTAWADAARARHRGHGGGR